MKKERNTGFENFSDWLKHDDLPHISSKGLSKVIKQNQIAVDPKNTRPDKTGTETMNSTFSHQPHIELDEKDGIVTGLKITCVCGELIHVHFEYDPESGETFVKS
ncbi:MAG TPA: hypothetical protein PLP19_06705 [bacterium]|nr:hypothetical protein [bacterium]HPN43160.1 hypothetical protein [bacterium]